MRSRNIRKYKIVYCIIALEIAILCYVLIFLDSNSDFKEKLKKVDDKPNDKYRELPFIHTEMVNSCPKILKGILPSTNEYYGLRCLFIVAILMPIINYNF